MARNLDAIVIVIGMDSKHDVETKKLANWLLHGLSSTDINGAPLHDSFSDSIFVIGKDSLQVYTN